MGNHCRVSNASRERPRRKKRCMRGDSPLILGMPLLDGQDDQVDGR